ncbi:MAG: orotate phosphoribosyltransferase [Pyrinomonadaceae bacterium]
MGILSGKLDAVKLLMDSILEHFKYCDAFLEGHFELSSGLHSPNYLQCALALQYPADASGYGRLIAEKFVDQNIDAVASPAIGGLVIGYTVAQALNVRFIWTERQNGEMKLRRGFSVRNRERFLVVEDVITTGGSTRECINVLTNAGAKVVGAASIIDRSNGTADVGVPRISLVSIDVPSYDPQNCPLCAAGTTAIKPGSRA